MNYKQINFEERVKIEYLFSECKNKISYITSEIKSSKSAIVREIKRNSTKGKYIVIKTQTYYLNRLISKQKIPEKLYPKFSSLFKKYFDKKWHGVESAWAGIKLKNQTFQWHNKAFWRLWNYRSRPW